MFDICNTFILYKEIADSFTFAIQKSTFTSNVETLFEILRNAICEIYFLCSLKTVIPQVSLVNVERLQG